jgi:hypothetical protein
MDKNQIFNMIKVHVIFSISARRPFLMPPYFLRREHCMGLNFISAILFAGVFAVSCKSREYNASETQNANDVVQKLPFNAYLLWRDGNKKADGTIVEPILDYPEGYDVLAGPAPRALIDGVFYEAPDRVEGKDYESLLKVTPGVKLEDDYLLTYPSKDGRELKLKFHLWSSPHPTFHPSAAQVCKEKGARLPILQELVDFCGSRKEEIQRINGATVFSPKSCMYWSATVSSTYRGHAYVFHGQPESGFAKKHTRQAGNGIPGNEAWRVCVSAP